MPKTQTSNQNDINKNKAQELNLNPLTTEVKQKPKISRKNLNLENPNQLNLNTKTEIKEKKRNSQAMLNKLNEEMNIHEKAKPSEKKLKKNNTKGKYISDKNEVSGLEALKDKDSLDSKDLPLNQVIKSQNIDIKGKLKAINTFNLGEEKINTKTNSPHNNKRQLTGKIKQIKKEQKKENINQSKTVMTTDAQNNDSLDDLWSDNEIDENKTNSNNKIKKTKFLTVSTNPFMTKVPKKSLRVESSKTISDLKQKLNMDNNINNNNANKIPDIKEQQKHTHHVKSTTLNLRNSIAQTSIPNTIRMNNDINNLGSINQNPKKILSSNTNANTNISEHLNTENIYRQFLFLAKRGDREKFLEIFGQILSLDKNNRDINYKDENGYSALHYACEEGNLKIVEILIDTHCNPNILNNLKQTPLHLSAKGGYFDISKKLIESGAILNIYDSEKIRLYIIYVKIIMLNC
jgi:ankyrin repeat protein